VTFTALASDIDAAQNAFAGVAAELYVLGSHDSVSPEIGLVFERSEVDQAISP
jgi:hypothetical protein